MVVSHVTFSVLLLALNVFLPLTDRRVILLDYPILAKIVTDGFDWRKSAAKKFAMWKSGIFSALSDEERKAILDRVVRKAYPMGAEIFTQGERGGSMLLIENGFVQVVKTTASGLRIHLGNLGAGAIVGEMTLLDQAPRTADVIAKSPVTGMLLSFSDMRRFLLDHPEIMFSVMLDLSRKLRAANALVENRAMEDGAARLAHCLLDLAGTFGVALSNGHVVIKQRLSQTTLGQMASLSRESVNRRLRDWSGQNVLTANRASITLHKPEALEAIIFAV